MQETIWKRLIYQGTDLGDFYLISNTGEIQGVKTGKIRRKNVMPTGYYSVVVTLGARGKYLCIRVHKAVAETFIENPNHFPVVNHIDGNKLNNLPQNLEWCTPKENTAHALRTGLMIPLKGINNGNAKVNDEIVKYIRETYIPRDKNCGSRALGRKFGLDHNNILRIINHEHWAHIQG